MKSQPAAANMTNPLPRSLNAWITTLDGVILPAFSGPHAQVRLALRDSSKSMRQIAELIHGSPVLALNVIREANRGLALGDNHAESLEAALGRIGLQRAEALLNRTPAMEAAQIPRPLRQIVVISRHASQQATGLFAGRLARLRPEIHWSSLLFLSPLWALVHAYPELLETWEQRVLVKGEPARKVEQALLGVPLLELCLAVAEHWRLPMWIIQGYRLLASNRRLLIKALHIARDNEHPLHQQQMLDADPELRRWLTHPGNTIMLANGLAVSAHHSWSGVHSLRWQRLAGLYLQVQVAELQQQIHQQAVNSARALGATDLWHPAQGLLWPWESLFQQPKVAPPPDAEALTAWRASCRQLIAEPSPFENSLQLIATAASALRNAGMQRVLLLQLERSQQYLVSQHAYGLPDAAGKLTLAPEKSKVLQRMMEKPLLLRLTPENIARFSALLPGALKAAFPSEHLLLRSVGLEGRVVMLAVADQEGAVFNETSVETFSKTIQYLERALLAFSKRRR